MHNDVYSISPAIYWLWIIPVACFAIFALRYRHNKVKLVDGVWFNLFFFSFLICLGFSIIGTQNAILINTAMYIALAIIVIIILTFMLQAFFFIWNGIIMWHRESHTLANTLTLIIGIVLLLEPIVIRLLQPFLPKVINVFFTNLGDSLFFYIFVWAYNFLTVSLLYQFNRPKPDQDYIIVLGAGLMNGDQVTPLLAARINRGLAFYQQQLAQTGKKAILIFSGGQGPGETTSEGQAMLQYALQQGLPAEQGIAETKSANTYENMRNSKEIIEQRPGTHNTIFVSNNYHTYRAARMARQVGLNADGIGAKTSLFFIPAALIREYVAIFLKYKKWHIFFFILALLSAFSAAYFSTR
ncbi:YdcF family protein [Lentilactobacillus senioris]|uniref:YdcF family protein n=1 Tax=Lentilactobacillus senioris TaxID=931534 RepID=UPI0022823E57|nr:YdcF family protein [Lentilactobacillus senioris]MCY9807401.1 YdcF family protein [Lentilactobacillus senioris]